MKQLSSLLLAFVFLYACSNPEGEPSKSSNPEDNAYTETLNEENEPQASTSQIVKKKAVKQAVDKVVMHPIKSTSFNMLMSEMPLPESWKFVSQKGADNVSMKGPNGLQIIDFPGQSFIFYSDPQMQQLYAQTGQSMRYLPAMDDLIEQDIMPWARNQGLTLTKKYSIPKVAEADWKYSSQLYKVGQTNDQFWAIGTEWENAKGEPFFLLMHLVASSGQGMLTWYYYCNGLAADKDYFPKATEQLIYGLANTTHNPVYIQAYNQSEAQKAGQSWAAHNQRMKANQASFEASQRAIVNSNNAVSDAIMSGWKSRNAISDAGHAKTINGISEQNTMIDPSSGQTYQVEAGSNQYWINPNGEYINTDDYNYNPNTDPTFNNENWQQLENYDQ
jgi:hypothetical protein